MGRNMGRTGQHDTFTHLRHIQLTRTTLPKLEQQIDVIFQILVLFSHPGDPAETYSSQKIYLVRQRLNRVAGNRVKIFNLGQSKNQI